MNQLVKIHTQKRWMSSLHSQGTIRNMNAKKGLLLASMKEKNSLSALSFVTTNINMSEKVMIHYLTYTLASYIHDSIYICFYFAKPTLKVNWNKWEAPKIFLIDYSNQDFFTLSLQFILTVEGRGGKFNLKNTILNIGSGLALLGVSTVVCDFLLMYIKEKGVVKKKK